MLFANHIIYVYTFLFSQEKIDGENDLKLQEMNQSQQHNEPPNVITNGTSNEAFEIDEVNGSNHSDSATLPSTKVDIEVPLKLHSTKQSDETQVEDTGQKSVASRFSIQSVSETVNMT